MSEQDRRRRQDAYREGYRKGKKQGFLDQMIDGIGNLAIGPLPTTDTYKSREKGRRDGNRNKYK